MIGNVRYLPIKLRKWYILYLICLILIYGWLLFTDQSAVLAVAILLVLFAIELAFMWHSENSFLGSVLVACLLYGIWMLPFVLR